MPQSIPFMEGVSRRNNGVRCSQFNHFGTIFQGPVLWIRMLRFICSGHNCCRNHERMLAKFLQVFLKLIRKLVHNGPTQFIDKVVAFPWWCHARPGPCSDCHVPWGVLGPVSESRSDCLAVVTELLRVDVKAVCELHNKYCGADAGRPWVIPNLSQHRPETAPFRIAPCSSSCML